MLLLRRFAWVIPAGYSLLLLAAGFYWLVTGAPFDQRTYSSLVGAEWTTFLAAQPTATARLLAALFRLIGGNTAILAGGLLLLIASTAYRAGLRWAWIALWLLPLHAAIDLFLVWRAGALTPRTLLWDTSLICLTIIAQFAARPSRRLTSA